MNFGCCVRAFWVKTFADDMFAHFELNCQSYDFLDLFAMLPAENRSWSLKAPKAAATKQWFFSANLQCGCCLTEIQQQDLTNTKRLISFSIFLLAPQNNSRTIIAWMPLHKGWQRMAFPRNSRISKATLSFAAGLPEMDVHIFRSIFRFQRTISPAPARPANDRKALCRMWAKKIQKCGKPHSNGFRLVYLA